MCYVYMHTYRPGNLSVYCSGAANKLNTFWCPIIEKRWFGGGISYVAFDIKFTSRQVGFFPQQLGFLEFCSRSYFPKKTHWAERFFYETMVCFWGVAKSSLFDDLATCFSIEFIFTNLAPQQKLLSTLRCARSSPIQRCLWLWEWRKQCFLRFLVRGFRPKQANTIFSTIF